MRTILITGATAGIGQAAARRFAQAGHCRLILNGRRQSALEDLQKMIDVPVAIAAFDVADRQAFKEGLAALPADFQDIDILINNAGLAFGMEPAYEGDGEDWGRMVDINIKGLLNGTELILPFMVKRNHGHVINLGSISALYAYAGGNVYGATKAFVHQFSKNLRADLLGTKVRVTTVAPGLVETEFFVKRFKGDNERAAGLFHNIQALKPEDIAEAIFWVCQQPEHVNVNMLEIMPTCQAPSVITVHR